jgi:predicted GNAT superfamily acetyltransferase
MLLNARFNFKKALGCILNGHLSQYYAMLGVIQKLYNFEHSKRIQSIFFLINIKLKRKSSLKWMSKI